jgi:glycopeptide antibiotics resistance protein
VLRALIMTLGAVALVAFSAVLARITLTPSEASAGIAGANLRPGHSLRQYAEEYTFLAACKQLGGNLLLGAPFGLILPVLVERRLRMLRVVFSAAAVMVLVELVQGAVVRGRAFDVDDVILNTTGALLAYLLVGRAIGRRFHALTDPRRYGQRDEPAGPVGKAGPVPPAPAPVTGPEPGAGGTGTGTRGSVTPPGRRLPGFLRALRQSRPRAPRRP